MDPGQNQMGGHGADEVGVVVADLDAGISGLAVGLDRAGGVDDVGDQTSETVGTVVGQTGKTQPARLVGAEDLDGTGEEHFAVIASLAAGRRVAW